MKMETALAEETRLRSDPRRYRLLPVSLFEGIYLALLPFAAVWLCGISIIDQATYADPEFYSGYGQSFARMWNVFGLTYYAARFPIMFLNTTTQEMVPGLGGYAIAHYLAFLTAAIPLYLLARRHYGLPVAVASCAFLVLNPLFPRILNWDLTIYLSIPAGLAGIVSWLLATRPWSPWIFVSGFLFAVALNSHVFTGTAIGVFLGVELLFSLRRAGGLKTFAIKCAAAAAGALACLLLGLLFYRLTVGPVSAMSLWLVTAFAVTAGRTYVATNFVPLSAYYATNYEIYVPVLVAVVGLALNRRRLLADTLDARISWFLMAYLGVYAVAVLVLGMNVVQYFWYFGHLTIAVYVMIPVILGRLSELAGRQAIPWFVGGLAAVSVVVNAGFDTVKRVSLDVSGSAVMVVAYVALIVAAAALLLIPRRMAVLSGAVLCGALLQVPYLSRTHLSMYDKSENAIERPLFDVIRGYHDVLNRYDTRERRVRTWYRTPDPTLMSVASSNLLFTLQSPWTGAGMPGIAKIERDTLLDSTTGYVLLMDVEPRNVDAGLRALADAQVKFVPVGRYTWGYAPERVSAALVQLTR